MSFYRTLAATVAAIGLASVAFAGDATSTAKQPAANTTQSADAQQATDAAQTGKVNLNKATAKELAKVKGITANKAKAIVAYRKKNGDFKSVEDLKEVKGFKRMNEKTMKEIQDRLTVG